MHANNDVCSAHQELTRVEPDVRRCASSSQSQVSINAGSLKGRQGEKDGNKWDIRMLYDGECPLCMREVNMLRGRDKDIGKIDFVDISSPDYAPDNNADISYEQVIDSPRNLFPCQ